MGYRSAQEVGHSIPLGVLAGAIAGVVWARMSGGSARVLTALSVGSIVLHDVLDLLQDGKRMPFWPLSEHRMGVEWLASSDRLWWELVVFGLPFAIYEIWRVAAPRQRPIATASASLATWIGRGLVLVVMLSAFTVLELRRERGRELGRAETLVRARKFAEALDAIDAADRWPLSSVTADLLRGRAYLGLGDAANAEVSFRHAYEHDPENFWTVASLAEYYASHGTSAERRQRSAPYVEELQRKFSDNTSLPRVLERIRAALANGG
jgi:tetratricopeptide (TPR) repeat protein